MSYLSAEIPCPEYDAFLGTSQNEVANVYSNGRDIITF